MCMSDLVDKLLEFDCSFLHPHLVSTVDHIDLRNIKIFETIVNEVKLPMRLSGQSSFSSTVG